MKALARRFWRDDSGLELSEYAVMAALIIIIAVGVILAVGNKISEIFGALLNALSGVA